MKNIKILLFILAIFLFWGATNVNAETGTGSVTVTVNVLTVAPTITSPTCTNITSTSMTAGANVTSLGYPTSIIRGTCVGNGPPGNCLAEGGTTTGVFTHTRTGLTPNTLYWVYGYATNSKGTTYTTNIQCRTLPAPVVPAVTSPTCTNIKSTNMTAGANVTSLGYPTSITRGTCVGNGPPGNCLAEGGTTTGVFTHTRTGLTPNTLYWVYGYATNSTGTAWTTNIQCRTLPAPAAPLAKRGFSVICKMVKFGYH